MLPAFNELLHTKSLMSLCDVVWHEDRVRTIPPDKSVVFVHADNIKHFFGKCCQNGRRYILVSAESDFGLYHQQEAHPNADLPGLLPYVPWQAMVGERGRYVQATIGPACKTEQCDIADKYSLKSWNFTHATFPDIPENVVHWFVANCNIVHPRVSWVPFGMALPEQGEFPLSLRSRPKRKLLYVNFERYTSERTHLKNHYASAGAVTCVAEARLPRGRYWQDIAEHKFVLCPEGNGLDCYRTYETLYLGSYPVMKRSCFSTYLGAAGLPVLLVDSLFNLDSCELSDKYEDMRRRSWNYSSVCLSYWTNTIREERTRLCSST